MFPFTAMNDTGRMGKIFVNFCIYMGGCQKNAVVPIRKICYNDKNSMGSMTFSQKGRMISYAT